MLTVLTAVLQIGNMTFEEHETTEAAAVTDEGHAKFVAQLLMVAEDSLIQLFSTRVSSIRGETITKTLRLKETNANRDATAKRLFGELFSFIVARLNQTLAPSSLTGTEVSIGLLDIFGFENFVRDNAHRSTAPDCARENAERMLLGSVSRAYARARESETSSTPPVSSREATWVFLVSLFMLTDAECMLATLGPTRTRPTIRSNSSAST